MELPGLLATDSSQIPPGKPISQIKPSLFGSFAIREKSGENIFSVGRAGLGDFLQSKKLVGRVNITAF